MPISRGESLTGQAVDDTERQIATERPDGIWLVFSHEDHTDIREAFFANGAVNVPGTSRYPE